MRSKRDTVTPTFQEKALAAHERKAANQPDHVYVHNRMAICDHILARLNLKPNFSTYWLVSNTGLSITRDNAPEIEARVRTALAALKGLVLK